MILFHALSRASFDLRQIKKCISTIFEIFFASGHFEQRLNKIYRFIFKKFNAKIIDLISTLQIQL